MMGVRTLSSLIVDPVRYLFVFAWFYKNLYTPDIITITWELTTIIPCVCPCALMRTGELEKKMSRYETYIKAVMRVNRGVLSGLSHCGGGLSANVQCNFIPKVKDWRIFGCDVECKRIGLTRLREKVGEEILFTEVNFANSWDGLNMLAGGMDNDKN